MITRAGIRAAVAAGLKVVADSQFPLGHINTFTPSLIGQALGSVAPGPQVQSIQRSISRFLLNEKTPAWTFNYWSRATPVYRDRPYPDDLDDTFCALAALHLADPAMLLPADYAQIIKLLVKQEEGEGGPYRTWVLDTDDPQWRDVDLAVNANVAYFLQLQDIHLPNLTALIDAAIRSRAFTTPYYSSAYTVIYFISRAYTGELASELRDYLLELREPAGHWGDPTNTALAVSALLNIGQPAASLKSAINYLVSARTSAGWGAGPVYIEENGQTVSAPALTAAFVCEALSKYLSLSNPSSKPRVAPNPVAEKIYSAAVAQVRARFAQLDEDFRLHSEAALGRLLAQDSDKQIILLPYLWASSLKNSQALADNARLTNLGAASLFGWIAYTLYDDFLDEEGSPTTLPVANISLRSLASIFAEQAPADSGSFIIAILDQIESANAWEVTHCRADVRAGKLTIDHFPDYGDLRRLAQRSLGHALGPIIILLGLGHAPGSPEVASTLEFFEHYLIARQLNDDVHDWEADLRKGHVNSISTLLLNSSGAAAGAQLGPLIDEMRDRLWNEQINVVCDLISDHLKIAELALARNPSLKNSAKLSKVLEPIQKSVDQARSESSATKEFIDAYKS